MISDLMSFQVLSGICLLECFWENSGDWKPQILDALLKDTVIGCLLRNYTEFIQIRSIGPAYRSHAWVQVGNPVYNEETNSSSLRQRWSFF